MKKIELTEKELDVIFHALSLLAWKDANPVIGAISKQLAEEPVKTPE